MFDLFFKEDPKMTMVKERAILKAKKQFDEMIRQAATESRMINEVEDGIFLARSESGNDYSKNRTSDSSGIC